MSDKAPPFAAVIRANAQRARPPPADTHLSRPASSLERAKPSGSRHSSTRARRVPLRQFICHGSVSRITSAAATMSSPEWMLIARTAAAVFTHASASRHQRCGQAAAGDASHRSCQLAPSKPDSQARRAWTPVRRCQRMWAVSARKGSRSSSASTSSSAWSKPGGNRPATRRRTRTPASPLRDRAGWGAGRGGRCRRCCRRPGRGSARRRRRRGAPGRGPRCAGADGSSSR